MAFEQFYLPHVVSEMLTKLAADLGQPKEAVLADAIRAYAAAQAKGETA